MPLGLINGGPFRPFNRAISARCSTTVRSSSATLPNSPTTSSRSWADDRTPRSNGGLTQSLNLTSPRRGKEKVHDRPGFCPCYLYGSLLGPFPLVWMSRSRLCAVKRPSHPPFWPKPWATVWLLVALRSLDIGAPPMPTGGG